MLKSIISQHVVLLSRPVSPPTSENFHRKKGIVPTPVSGQVLRRTPYLLFDPYKHGQMSVDPFYALPVVLGMAGRP